MFAVNVGTSHLKNAHANRPTVETALEKIEANRSSEPFVPKRKIMDILAEQQLSTTHPVSVNVHRAILENIALHNSLFCLSTIVASFKSITCWILRSCATKQIIFPNTSPKKVTSGHRKQWAEDYRASIKYSLPQTCTKTDLLDMYTFHSHSIEPLVCTYVGMYVSIYVCMYVCMYVCVYICMYACMCECM